jgi:dynactin complex subunit
MTLTIKESQLAEYEQLISELRRQAKQDQDVIDRLEKKVGDYQCLQDKCGRLQEEVYQKDYKVENWKYQYKTLMDQNAELKKENLTMRELIRQWA